MTPVVGSNPELEYKKQVQIQYDALHMAYDRVVLLLAGGALTLSITFIADIAPAAVDVWKLEWGWGLLIGSLLFVALSYIPSISAHQRELKGLPHTWQDRIANWLSVTAGPLLAGGFTFLAWFVITNLKGAP